MIKSSNDIFLREILSETKTIVAVGVSTNVVRPSHFVARYLHYRGYRVIPVNPVAAGQVLFGEPVLAGFEDIPKNTQVDLVDIFRRSEHVPAILDDAIKHLTPHLKTVWMQVGVQNEEAAQQARSMGLKVVQNKCPKIEFQRLYGELRKAGINTGIVSSKLPEWL